MMLNRFKQLYYIKKLYLQTCCILIDCIYQNCIGLTHKSKLENLLHTIADDEKNLYFFKDLSGRRFSQLCSLTAEKLADRSDIFLFKDDCSNCEKWIAVFILCSKKFICLRNNGCDMDDCYYRKTLIDDRQKMYLQMAKCYFEKSEYIAKNSGL